MENTSCFHKSLLGGLLVGFFLFFLFIPAFQAQAALGSTCTTTNASTTCKVGNNIYSCTQEKCTGPCVSDSECSTSVGSPLGWGGTKCTGTTGSPGVCLELPRSESKLKDEALTTTGAGLLTLIDTLTNWVFAVFVVLAIIFILLAALQFVTAGGEATKVGEARQKLIWATVGIIIALLSKGLVPVIRAIVGG